MSTQGHEHGLDPDLPLLTTTVEKLIQWARRERRPVQSLESVQEQLDALAPAPGETEALLRVPAMSYGGKIDAITFSGGVSEFVYGYETSNFGDLGAALAAAVRKRIDASGLKLMEPVEGIRATVIGASQFTVQVSGKTIAGAGNVSVTGLDATAAANLSTITASGTLSAAVSNDVTFTGNLGTFTTTVASGKTLTAAASVVATTPATVTAICAATTPVAAEASAAPMAPREKP